MVDGSPVGTVTPSSTSYASYQTSNFTISTAGLHTIEFAGLNPMGGDNTAFIDEVAINAASSLGDSSFETPGLAAKTFRYSPDGSPWQFSGGAGVSSNGSGFTAGNPNAPDGTQVAFLQCNGSMSQPVSMDAGTYSLSFLAAQRAGAANKHYQEIQVLIDGSPVSTVTPTGSSYALYQNVHFHRNDQDAHHRVRRHGPARRRQHGLHRRGGAYGGKLDQRQHFHGAETRRGCRPDPGRRDRA